MPRKGETVSAEMRARISAALTGRPSANKGVPKSLEHRAKIAATNLGKKASDETRAKMRVSQALRPPKSAETKAKMSAAAMGRTHSDATRAAMSAAKKGKPGHAHTDESKEKLSAAHKGKRLTAEHRIKLSGRNSTHWGKPPKHKERVTYAGVSFRSTWESRFAQALDRRRIEWEYEKHRFDLGECTYLPDFYLPETGVFWEVKGWLDSVSQRKTSLFREKYPDIPLVVATKPILQLMEF